MSNVASVKVSFIAFGDAFFLKATQLICTTIALFVFLIGGQKQNARSLLTSVSDTVFLLFHMVVSVLLSSVHGSLSNNFFIGQYFLTTKMKASM